MGQLDFPLSMPGGFKSLSAAKSHREIMSKVTGLRTEAETAAAALKSFDVADIASIGSEEGKDLAAGLGHVIVLNSDDSGHVGGAELRYNPQDGSVRSFVGEKPDGKLTQGPSSVGSSFSPTFKWESKQGDTTYFKFDDNRGVISILDLDNEIPAILGKADVKDLIGKTFQGGIPIITF